MADISVLNSNFVSAGKITTNVNLGPDAINTPVVHQVVKALLAAKRQGNACTKTKAFVSGGGKKPFKQKGTGRARQGSSRSPLMPGGGTVFGPLPRSYEQKVNKKVATLAIQSIIADKFQAGKLTVVEKIQSTGKTKDMYKTLSEKNLLPALLVTEDKDSKALRAIRNMQYGKGMPVEGFSVLEALKFENLIIEKRALETLLTKLV